MFTSCSLNKFDNFEIDFNLPKWQDRKTEGDHFLMYNRMSRNRDGWGVTSGISLMPSQNFVFDGGNISVACGSSGVTNKTSFFDRFFRKNRKQREADERAKQAAYEPPKIVEIKIEEQPPLVSVQEFFTSVKNSVEEIELIKERLENYYKALENFKKMGQISLYESMKMDVELYRAESQLYAIDMRKYVTEANVIKFAKHSDKAIRLDWIKNFVRLIPSEVAEKKIKADELHIFDNYLVMHYDPEGKANEMTAEERAAKEDPILFGVICGSRKLYYVGDWIDQYCDLTLEGMMTAIEEETIPSITAEI